jgi:hypothetical protein
VVWQQLRHAAVGRGWQPGGSGARSRMGELGEGREGAGKWASPWGGPCLSAREGERGSLLTGGSGRRAVPDSNGLKNNPNLIET